MVESPNVGTLKKRRDFVRVQGSTQKRRGKRVIVVKDRNPDDFIRVGFTVSKRVGNAVTRNRVKRRLREIVRLAPRLLESGWDYVVIARPSAALVTYQALRKDVECQLHGLQS